MTKFEEQATELFGEMRYATMEERESVDAYVKSVSAFTGVNFWEQVMVHQVVPIKTKNKFYEDGMLLSSHPKIPVTLHIDKIIKHQPNFDLEDIDEDSSDV